MLRVLLARTGAYAVMALTTLCAGAAVGALALLGRSELLYGNAALYLILVLSGAVPAPALPGWTDTVAGLLPLTHGIEALHRSLDGEPVATRTVADGSHIHNGIPRPSNQWGKRPGLSFIDIFGSQPF